MRHFASCRSRARAEVEKALQLRFCIARGSCAFRYVVPADVGTMGKNRDEGDTANWRMSG
jgi:hypothetical protein